MKNKWLQTYIVDHRNRRLDNINCTFVFPEDSTSIGLVKTVGMFGADYAELRAWELSLQNNDSEFGAIFHYRRVMLLNIANELDKVFYNKRTWEGYFLNYWNWAESPEFGWCKETFQELDINAVYIPEELDNRIFGANNNYEQFLLSHPIEILEAIEKKWENGKSFIDFLKSTHHTTPYNMIVASFENRKKAFDWLIPILNSLEPDLISLSNDPYQKRWPGFLAERLLTYYWSIETDVIIKRVPVARLDTALEVEHHIASLSGRSAMFATDENYLEITLASIECYAQNFKIPVNFILLVAADPSKNEHLEDLVDYFRGTYSHHEFSFILLNKNIDQIGFQNASVWSKATFLRFATLLITADKDAIWFDGDTLPMGSIDDIFEFSLGNNSIAMAPDLFLSKQRNAHFSDIRFNYETWFQYYNRILPKSEYDLIYQAGIIYFKVSDLKENGDLAKLIKLSMQKEFPGAPDQDILNIVFKNRIARLPLRFNFVNYWSKDVNSYLHSPLSDLERLAIKEWLGVEKPSIIHFTGENQSKPFRSFESSRFNFLYYGMINKTQFGSKIIGSILDHERVTPLKFQRNESLAKSILGLLRNEFSFRLLQEIYFKLPLKIRKNEKLIKYRRKIYHWYKK